ncbi:hypothetical protein RB2478 [Rhodopirellula baltica SH 1]|uniref:Uncharacterized protein n=1 Tax=Rhodopirellula baltica (strain DSM 10527 / NCIMB 13988 / SH1) TaxID=243090 RepID=Q7UVR8_RHOBA|nr:hypothetical protein RB2478 [Rhodopirellula baltica SH 1]
MRQNTDCWCSQSMASQSSTKRGVPSARGVDKICRIFKS